MKYVFRAWYKDEPYKFTQRVIHDELVFIMKDIYVYKYPFYIPFVDSDWTVEQFTGIYDSTTWKELTEQEREEWVQWGNMPSEWKGKMIFEGDIVSYRSGETVDVQYKEKEVSRVYGQGDVGIDRFVGFEFSGYYGDTQDIKVIGNIHQNPELLENIELLEAQ